MSIDTATSQQALLRLMTWLSPAFPVGGFSYSHGLEAAIARDHLTNRSDLLDWISALIAHGSVWNDCLLLGDAMRATTPKALADCAELAEALAGSSERHLETMAQGKAFMDASSPWSGAAKLPEALPLPVAVGAVAALNGLKPSQTIAAYLQAFTTNQVQAALRLMALGQKNGVWVLHQLEPVILKVAEKAEHAHLTELGSATIVAEISAMQHETMASRIFRS